MNSDIAIIDRGRMGIIRYSAEGLSYDFYYEFAADTCLATILVPDPEEWEEKTRLNPEVRNIVLKLIAEKVIADKAAGCTYTISDHFVEIMPVAGHLRKIAEA